MNSSVTRLRLLVSLTAASVAAVLTGCQTSPYAFHEVASGGSTNSPPALSTASPVNAQAGTNKERSGPSPDRLLPGHKIKITFSGNPNAPEKHEESVRDDGYISPPLLNRPVKASDKTVGELQEELHGLYVPALFRSLTVTVTTEERWFYVGGEVKIPNRYIYSGEMTVLRAIQAAGDFTPYSKRTKVQLTRASGRTETINCDKALRNPRLDLPVYPGDSINVPSRILFK